MRRVLIATMLLVIPSFVLLYGWGQIQSSNAMALASVGAVEVATADGPRVVEIDGRKADAIRDAVAYSAALRASRMGGITAERARDVAKRDVSNDHIAYEFAKTMAMEEMANSLGLSATDEEAAERVRAMFSTWTEEQIAGYVQRMAGLTLEQYLEEQRRGLTIAHARDLLASDAKASLYELWQEYLLSNEEIEVEFATIAANSFFQQVAPTDEDLLAYFEKNREEFKVPAKIQVEYISTSAREMVPEIQAALTDEDLRAEFDKQVAAGSMASEEVMVRPIFLSLENRTEEEALTLANTLKMRLSFGEDFNALAAEFSDSAIPGADETMEILGRPTNQSLQISVRRSQEPGREFHSQEIRDAAFSAAAGSITEPVLTDMNGQRGVAILAIDEKRDLFEGAKTRLSNTLAQAKAQEKLKQLRREWESQAAAATTMSTVADKLGAKIQGPVWINFDGENIGSIPGVGSLRDGAGLVRVLREDGGVGVLQLPSALVALRVVDSKRAYVPKKIEDDEATSRSLSSVVRNKKASELAEARAREVLAAVQDAPSSFTEIVREKGLSPQNTGKFTRLAPTNPNLRGVEDFATKTLAARVGSVHMDVSQKTSTGVATGFVVWRLANRVEPSREEFQKEFPRLQFSYLSSKGEGLVEEEYRDLFDRGALKLRPVASNR